MPLTDIIFEFLDAKKEYARGKYGEFEVIMTKDGYVNATKLCNGKGKRFDNWLQNKSSKELINEINSCAPCFQGAQKKCIVKLMGGKNMEIKGTYVHPDLVPHIASWISPVFALKVSKIVNEYLVQEYKNRLSESEKLIMKKDGIIQKKKGKITELIEKVDKLLENNGELKEMVSGLQTQNDTLEEKLDGALYHKNIPPSDDSYTHKFALLKINDTKFKYDYHVIRIQKRSYEKTCKAYKFAHPKCEVLVNLEYSPNSISLWNRITEEISDNFKKRNVNDFSLKKSFSEKEMIARIKEIHNSRYNTEA
ncbi:MAG TPA: KilA-N domain-containing protein [Nitrosarchaeum sp.]|nr:KilA-N domain-containing protein [Nitrosarchaeum sp.]